MKKYINSFKTTSNYTEYFYTEKDLLPYREYLVAENLRGSFDIVKDGFCIAQRVTIKGAKQFIDMIHSEKHDYLVKRSQEILNSMLTFKNNKAILSTYQGTTP